VAMLPPDMNEVENLDEAFLYLYFCVRYYEEHIFNVILTKANKFIRSPNQAITRLLAGPNQRLFNGLTAYTAGSSAK